MVENGQRIEEHRTNAEVIHDALQREADHRFPYFRFNVERDVSDIGLEDWKKMDSLPPHTAAYMSIFESEKRKIICAKCFIDSSNFYCM